jgi:hypothetical protein
MDQRQYFMGTALDLPGTVYAIGSDAIAASRTYAELTGRDCRNWNSASEVIASGDDVIVCTTRNLTPALMNQLYVEAQGGAVPGLICADNGADLADICGRTAAKMGEPPPDERERVFICARLPFTSGRTGGDIVVGGLESIENLLPVLGLGASVMVITGPSNGFALALSMRQCACPFLDSRSEESRLVPVCQTSGRCTAFPVKPTIADARKKNWIVPLSQLRAEIGILYSCNVLRLQDGIFDPAYGLASRALLHSQFGAIVTTWRTEIGPITGVHLNGLVNDICRGISVGMAVGEFNGSDFATRFGVKLCVLGDPLFALAPEQHYVQLSVPSVTTVAPTVALSIPEGSDSTTAELHLLRSAVAYTIQANKYYDTQKGEALAAQLLTYASTLAAVPDKDKRDLFFHLDTELSQFLSASPFLDSFFEPFFSIEDMSEKATCPSCLAPARDFRAQFSLVHSRSLHVIRCACCYDSKCLPSNWDVQLMLNRINEGIIEISNVPAEAVVSVCLLVHPSRELHKAYPWPSSGGEWPPFELPKPDISTAFYCHILIARHLLVGSLGFKLRGSRAGWESSCAS